MLADGIEKWAEVVLHVHARNWEIAKKPTNRRPMRGDQKDRNVWQRFVNSSCRIQAVHDRHRVVEDDNVRPQLLRKPECFSSVLCFEASSQAPRLEIFLQRRSQWAEIIRDEKFWHFVAPSLCEKGVES